jgi:hypothetical protein
MSEDGEEYRAVSIIDVQLGGLGRHLGLFSTAALM